MRNIEWTLLEWVVPVATWMHLALGPVPQLMTAVLVLALIGGLLAAICVVGGRLHAVRPVALPAPHERIAAPFVVRWCDGRGRPVGGSGPRAPAVEGIRSLVRL